MGHGHDDGGEHDARRLPYRRHGGRSPSLWWVPATFVVTFVLVFLFVIVRH